MPRFRLLGPFEVRADGGRLVPAGRRKQRTLLAMLVLRAGSVVRTDEVLETLWDGSPPPSARANVHTYVSALRQVLDRAAAGLAARLVACPGGYRLDLSAGECDVTAFGDLAADGRRALDEGQWSRAVERLSRALGLWRGPVLEDLGDAGWLEPYAARLAEARLAAVADQVEARLALGEHAALVTELAGLTTEHPLRERFWAQYLRALHGSGARARALHAYAEVSDLLRSELGVQPGRELREVHRALRDDVVAPGPAETLPGGPRPRAAPALLPPAVPDFTGRDEELRLLHKRLSPNAPRLGLAVTAVTGMAGVGKTTLAVQAAHAIAPAYPDGQLYADLAGTDPVPVSAADVLGRFLRALGVPSPAVPSDPDERAELYRTLLAGRRVLVVLDDAGSERQVRPLLPGSASCSVLLTSRSRLAGVAGARWTELGVLAGDEGVRLLARIVGDSRIDDDPAAAEAVVRQCGGLPLAVRIAGARLAARPAHTAAYLVSLLRDEQRRLDRLDAGDLRVRASLALSHAALSAPARRLFRLLGTLEVPDFAGWLATVLAAGTAADPVGDLDELVDAHLVEVAGTDPAGQVRHRFHDLVRLFAREQAAAGEEPVAVGRAVGGWLAVAERLEPGLPGPCFAPIAGAAPRPDAGPVVAGPVAADPLAWFDAEQASIRAVLRQACRTGHHEAAYDLTQRMEKYFDVRGMYAEWEETSRLVLTACRAAGNRRGEAVVLRGLVDVTTWIAADRSAEAMTASHTEAVRLQELFREAGEPGGMADAAVMRSWSLTAMGRHAEAVDAATEALGWARTAAHLGGQAKAQVALAVALGESARLPEAVGHLHEALSRARELGNPRYIATVLQFLGIGYCRAGRFAESRAFLDESLAISRRHRDAYPEALTLIALARLHLARGDEQARPAAEAALRTAREHRMPHHVAEALGLLGEIELAAGRTDRAIAHLRESVAVWRTRGWLRFLADALALLGRASAGVDPEAARAALREAGELYARAGDPGAAAEVTGSLRDDPP